MSASAITQPVSGIHADVWHAHALSTAPIRVLATGSAALDAQLPGGGWPVGALTEVLQSDGVHCEWRLLLPALARCGRGAVVLVGAPYVPFAPALEAQGLAVHRLLWMAAQTPAQRLWTAEQALRCAEVDAVLAWLPAGRADTVRTDQLRRLQMAASEYSKLLFVMRPVAARADASPAVLRLQVGGDAQRVDALEVQLLKRRGPPCDQPLTLQACPAQLSMLLAVVGQSLRRPGDALDRAAARAA